MAEPNPRDLFQFPSLQNSNIKKLPNTSDYRAYYNATTYKYHTKGMFLVGKCIDEDCLLNNRQVWVCIGEGDFIMAQTVLNTACSYCDNNIVDVNKAAIYNCLMVAKGRTQTDLSERVIEQQIYQTDSLMIFGERDQDQRWWKYLRIKITQPKKCPQHNLTLGNYQERLTKWKCSSCGVDKRSKQKSKCCPNQTCTYDLCWNCI